MGATLTAAIVTSVAVLLLWVAPMTWALAQTERLWGALLHGRRAGAWLGLADLGKLIFKEWLVPARSVPAPFVWAPIITLAVALALFLPIPFGAPLAVGERLVPLQVTSGSAGLLIILALSGWGAWGILLGAWASGNQLALQGGLRAAMLVLASRVPLLLSLTAVALALGTTDLAAAVVAQQPRTWAGLPSWGLLLQPLGAFVFLAAGLIDSMHAPFDVHQAESELVAFDSEYNASGLAAFLLAERVRVLGLATLFVILYLGGWELPGVLEHGILLGRWQLGPLGTACAGVLLLAGKVLLLGLALAHLRWSVPRARYRSVLTWGWRFLLPAGLINLIATALLAWSNALAPVGLALLAAVALALLLGPRAVRVTTP